MTENPDSQTLAAIAKGCEKASTEIFRRYERQVYTLAQRICHNEADALDVLQDTFVLAFAKVEQFRGDHFWAWLKKIAVNQALTRLRKQRRGPLLVALDAARNLVGTTPSAAPQMDLNAAFARLSPDTRAVVWLYDVEGYSHKEIAELFGRTVSFSKTQVSRAHQQMRGWLADTPQEQPCLSNPTT
ncbi:MAG: sigma-70 family RNA polymerase sigma factor [Pseudomonadota bacterium]